MTLLSIDELKTLIENSQTPCVSLYMPMQKAGPEIRQNPIRFKNLVREAEERLQELEIFPTEVENLLQQVQELDQAEFWENQDHGLAILLQSADRVSRIGSSEQSISFQAITAFN